MCCSGGGVGSLAAGHSYSIVSVRYTCGRRMIEVKNPWGVGDWQGKWSLNSEDWINNPQMSKHLKYNPAAPKAKLTFWMDWEDFVHCFNELCICHLARNLKLFGYHHYGFGKCAPLCGCIYGLVRFWCCDGPVQFFVPVLH
eukprot:Platyproteum_vivax@DN6273_c0_g1_i1.p1